MFLLLPRHWSLCRNLYDGFDKIDGKPTQAEIKAQAQAEEQKKKREVSC